MTRRSSSGGLLSPEVELNSQTEQKLIDDQEGFYLLKKDSQRRMTLTRVLSQDESKICQVWLRNIHQDVGMTLLNMSHLEKLMRGIRDYISDHNHESIIISFKLLKDELDFNSTTINHLHLAIYLFQTAVNEVLRLHNIKPHWMFALDNLVRNAVQTAITVLSPELVYEQDRQTNNNSQIHEDGSTSGVSTINSIKSHKLIDQNYWHEYKEQIGNLKIDNNKLLQELVDGQKIFYNIITQIIDEQKKQITILNQFCQDINEKFTNKITE